MSTDTDTAPPPASSTAPSATLPLSSGALFIAIFGRKGSGKSELARVLWLGYPYDRAVLDPTGDVGPRLPDGSFREVHEPLGKSWPKRDDERRSSLRYKPRRSSPEYLANMDRFIGWQMEHAGPSCLWVDEIGRVARRDKTLPRLAEILEEGRHADVTLITCGPRPAGIDPLVIAQADYVYIFDLPQSYDRRTLADTMGYDAEILDDAIDALPEHGYLRFDARATKDSGLRLVEFDPLPLEHG